MKFEELAKSLDPYTKVEIYESGKDRISDKVLFNGMIKDLRVYPEYVMSITPQRTSREVYLEIKVY